MSRMGEHVREQQEAEDAKEYRDWFESRSIEPINKERDSSLPPQKAAPTDETLPF